MCTFNITTTLKHAHARTHAVRSWEPRREAQFRRKWSPAKGPELGVRCPHTDVARGRKCAEKCGSAPAAAAGPRAPTPPPALPAQTHPGRPVRVSLHLRENQISCLVVPRPRASHVCGGAPSLCSPSVPRGLNDHRSVYPPQSHRQK